MADDLNVAPAARSLLSAAAVRARAQTMLRLAEADRLLHFRLDETRFAPTVDYVLETIRLNYPSLQIPFHARWRHFSAAGKDRWAALTNRTGWKSAAARARAAFDLAIVSVLLDAGAGAYWRYREADGTVTARSEGLAVASFDMFAAGRFAVDGSPRADAGVLAGLPESVLAEGFQVDPGNPLVGLAGRVQLLNALGRAVLAAPAVFATQDTPRPGGLFDLLASRAEAGRLPATAILDGLLRHLGPIWPSRLTLDGVPLGDCWRHPLLVTDDATSGLVPFHKLSQWLSYSLIEPLQEAGIEVVGIDGLTGLPEYRNGGLLIDLGLLRLKDEAERDRPHEPGSTLVVEWRALTVALLDRIGAALRERLGFDAEAFPLAKALEGGTWAAGRRIAAELRPGGPPPLAIISDGTVF